MLFLHRRRNVNIKNIGGGEGQGLEYWGSKGGGGGGQIPSRHNDEDATIDVASASFNVMCPLGF